MNNITELRTVVEDAYTPFHHSIQELPVADRDALDPYLTDFYKSVQNQLREDHYLSILCDEVAVLSDASRAVIIEQFNDLFNAVIDLKMAETRRQKVRHMRRLLDGGG